MEVLNKEHITRGEAKSCITNTATGAFYKVKSGTKGICNIITRNQEEAEANAEFIKDCFNVLNESGKTARELLSDFYDQKIISELRLKEIDDLRKQLLNK